MTTVGEVIDRLYLQILTPPSAQPAIVHLGADMDTTETTLTLGTFAVPEDSALLRQGIVLNVGLETMRVTSYVLNASSCEVERNVYSTPPAAHTAGDAVILSPEYARKSVFDAVVDNIVTLYPSLASTNTDTLVAVGDNVFPVADDLAVSVIEIWDGALAEFRQAVEGRIVSYHPLTGARALLTGGSTGVVWVRYRRRMGVATSEADILEDLGVDDTWINIIVIGAAATLLAGRDIPASQTEWISATLEAENIRVGTRLSIAGGLRQYRNQLLSDASKEMKAEDSQKVKVHMKTSMPPMGY
jgi:hypothetical protein